MREFDRLRQQFREAAVGVFIMGVGVGMLIMAFVVSL